MQCWTDYIIEEIKNKEKIAHLTRLRVRLVFRAKPTGVFSSLFCYFVISVHYVNTKVSSEYYIRLGPEIYPTRQLESLRLSCLSRIESWANRRKDDFPNTKIFFKTRRNKRR